MFIVQELQTSAEGNVAFLPPITQEDANKAESEFYIKVGYAAISSVWRHTIMLFSEDGAMYKFKCYQHDVNGTQVLIDHDTDLPREEPEPEPEE